MILRGKPSPDISTKTVFTASNVVYIMSFYESIYRGPKLSLAYLRNLLISHAMYGDSSLSLDIVEFLIMNGVSSCRFTLLHLAAMERKMIDLLHRHGLVASDDENSGEIVNTTRRVFAGSASIMSMS